jgi:hypothetical protein
MGIASLHPSHEGSHLIGRIWRNISLAILSMMLTGCATLDESQCKTIDWRDLGARDAYDGQDLSRIESHRTACADYGIQPDRSAYAVGFGEGLRRLCTAPRGYNFGVDGRSYRNICPLELDAYFQQGLRLGRDVRQEASRISSLQNQMRSAEDALRRSQDANDRSRMRRQIQNIDDEIREAQRRLRQLEDEAAQLGYR